MVRNYFGRMSNPRGQIKNTSSELLTERNRNEHNIDQLLHVEIIIDSHLALPFNQDNMIPSETPDNTAYVTRRRQRQRRVQR